jgi:putative transposase
MIFSITSYKDYLNHWKELKDRLPLNIECGEIRCKFCKSSNIIRYGYFKNMQRWWCKDCQRKFAYNSAFPGMRTPWNQVASVLRMHYDGAPVDNIRRMLWRDYGNYPADSTMYEWINRFTQQGIKESEKYHPKVGNSWAVYETILRINGRNYWINDVFDLDTRFLLMTRLYNKRNISNVSSILESAAAKARKIPEKILTNKWKSYRRGIELSYKEKRNHFKFEPFDKKIYGELIENWQAILKGRKEIMHFLKNKEGAQFTLDGWSIHYNYFRPNESLSGLTPARESGIKLNFEVGLTLPDI